MSRWPWPGSCLIRLVCPLPCTVAAVVYQYLQEEQATQEHAEALMALSTEQGFAQRLAQGRILLGWTMVEQGRVAEGIAQMRQSVAAYGATGADLGRS